MSLAVMNSALAIMLLFNSGVPVVCNPGMSRVGCSPSERNMMSELARRYEAQTGHKLNIEGGADEQVPPQPASSEERFLAKGCWVTAEDPAQTARTHQIPVARYALMIIVHPDNPVATISVDQLRGIYLGRITNWRELGGADAPIEPYIRQGKLSAVGGLFRELVFANFEQDLPGARHTVLSSAPLEQAVEANPDAIGVTGMDTVGRHKVKVLKLNGIEASEENILAGRYIMLRPLYLIVKGELTHPATRAFLQFVASNEGQAAIRTSGTTPAMHAVTMMLQQIEQYEQRTQGAADK